jgi:hypothetical protein
MLYCLVYNSYSNSVMFCVEYWFSNKYGDYDCDRLLLWQVLIIIFID